MPGLIDFNIKLNNEWENLEKVTLKALCGGVTCIGVE